VDRPESASCRCSNHFETIASGIDLSAEEIDFITSLWTPRQLRRGQFFQRAGEVATHGGFVVRGCLRTYVVDTRGGESIIHFSPNAPSSATSRAR
jgi:CRP-like cAMP-binding protein